MWYFCAGSSCPCASAVVPTFCKKHRVREESTLSCERYVNRKSNVKSEKSVRVRVLTAADMHQSWLHYRSLGLATQAHRPDVVSIVGDALHAFPISFKRQFTTAECA